MSAEVFLDTNILVYGVVQNDRRSTQAAALLAQGGTISVQVLNEFANVARRKLRHTWPQIVDALGALRVLFPDPKPISVATHEAALRIAEREGLRFTTH
jgi:predicted nucleic acid-binding protein